jgi:ADP-ribose 1''-phosphate phosphatase
MHDIEDIYAHDTDTATVRMPLGTALIIPPQAADARPRRKKHWIVCLFTSKGYGQHVDRSEQIINSTLAALEDLKEKLADLRLDGTEPSPTALYSCRFNSGLFAVPWSQTRAAIELVGLEMTVMTLPGGNDDQE